MSFGPFLTRSQNSLWQICWHLSSGIKTIWDFWSSSFCGHLATKLD